MSVLKLSELLGTRYPCDWHSSQLDLLFESHVGDTIDLAGCNFTPGAIISVYKYDSKVRFVNTEDRGKDSILEHNRNARQLKGKVKTEQILNTYSSIDDIAKYIHDLDSGVVLDATQMPSGMSLTREICNLVQIIRPEIRIDFGSALAGYFRSVREYWLRRAKPTDAYWEVCNAGLVVREVSEGFVEDGKMRRVKESDFVSNNLVLPWRFGRERLVNDPEFKGMVENSLRNIEVLKKSSPRMRDYLKF